MVSRGAEDSSRDLLSEAEVLLNFRHADFELALVDFCFLETW
jgi:hypothetical protein